MHGEFVPIDNKLLKKLSDDLDEVLIMVDEEDVTEVTDTKASIGK